MSAVFWRKFSGYEWKVGDVLKLGVRLLTGQRAQL